MVAYGVAIVFRATGSDYLAIVLPVGSATVAGLLLLWGISGLMPLLQMHRLVAGHPNSEVFATQRTDDLLSSLTQLKEGEAVTSFLYLLLASPKAVSIYAQGRLILSIPWAEVKTIESSTTVVRGLDLPCVALHVDTGQGNAVVRFQPGSSPWSALFPTRPEKVAKVSALLSSLASAS